MLSLQPRKQRHASATDRCTTDRSTTLPQRRAHSAPTPHNLLPAPHDLTHAAPDTDARVDLSNSLNVTQNTSTSRSLGGCPNLDARSSTTEQVTTMFG